MSVFSVILAIIIVVTVVKEDQLDCPAHAGRFTMIICAWWLRTSNQFIGQQFKEII